MSSDYTQSFGAYDYSAIDGLSIMSMTDSVEVKPRMANTPGRDGGYSAGGLLANKRVVMHGLMKASTGADLWDKWEVFKAAHRPNSPQTLYIRDDRYLLAEVKSIGNVEFGNTARTHITFQVEFEGADPFAYHPDEESQSGLAGGGTIANDGTAYALPVLSLVVSSIGTDGTIIISNDTTGQTFTLQPSATGTYVIDSLEETVTKASVDKSGERFGEFLRLDPGDNDITVSTTGGAAVSTLGATWLKRYV